MNDLPHVFPTVVHMLIDAVERAPDREALVYDEERLSYIEYLRCVTGFTAELQVLGVKGERVALIMGNSNDICIAMFAIHMAGAQAVPLNPIYTENELRPMLEAAQVRLLIYDEKNHDRDSKLADDLNITGRICIGRNARRLIEWSRCPDVKLPDVLPGPEDLATLQFTGGTTGLAKGANITHHSLSINISQREAIFPYRDDEERILCIMPLYHCYAVSMCLHAMVYRRGTLVMLPHYHPAEVLQTLSSEKITLFAGSPTLFTGLMSYQGFNDTDFSRLYLSSSGSAPLPEELIKKWEAITGTPVIEGYGQSEASPVISFNPLHGIRKPASVGVALPLTEIEIVDLESGNKVLPCGENGEIRIRGPQVMQGYRNQAEETKNVLRDCWLYTGDIGELDADGYLFIRGRKKEMIIVSGYNVFPREVEEILHRNPAIKEAAVVGKVDDYRGELPVAFIVTHDNKTLSEKQLTDYCIKNMAKYKVPVEFRFMEQLPKTTVGKVNKLALSGMVNDNDKYR